MTHQPTSRRSRVSTTLILLAAGLAIGTGCAAESANEEAVGTSSDPLTMACGTKGKTSCERWGTGGKGGTIMAGYVEAISQEKCIAAECIKPTQAELKKAADFASAYMIEDCKDEMSRHDCPAGCKLTVVPTCTIVSMRMFGPTNTCTENAQGKWQKECRYAIQAHVQGTADVTCGPMGSAPIPDGGTDSGSDGGSTSSDSGSSTSDGGTAPTDAGTSG